MHVRINTLFSWCNDASAMRGFYTDILGLKEAFSDIERGWLRYDIDGLQLVFMRGTKPLPIASEWARQPAWKEGTKEVASIVIEYPLTEFLAVVARAKAADTTALGTNTSGDGRSDLAQLLRDPMGATVEIYYEAKKS